MSPNVVKLKMRELFCFRYSLAQIILPHNIVGLCVLKHNGAGGVQYQNRHKTTYVRCYFFIGVFEAQIIFGIYYFK
jgi:hypothetical protein